jgi:hypothetical protein
MCPFPRTPVLCAYRPVKIEARDGQQSGVVANVFGKLTPPLTKYRLVFGITDSQPVARWSSVTKIRMLGRGSACANACPAPSGRNASAVSRNTAIVTTRRHEKERKPVIWTP